MAMKNERNQIQDVQRSTEYFNRPSRYQKILILFKYYVSRYGIAVGNPELRPSTWWNIRLRSNIEFNGGEFKFRANLCKVIKYIRPNNNDGYNLKCINNTME